jgi:hypothetical protein
MLTVSRTTHPSYLQRDCGETKMKKSFLGMLPLARMTIGEMTANAAPLDALSGGATFTYTYCPARGKVAAGVGKHGSSAVNSPMSAVSGGQNFYTVYGPMQTH